jgi:hypothetical protein
MAVITVFHHSRVIPQPQCFLHSSCLSKLRRGITLRTIPYNLAKNLLLRASKDINRKVCRLPIPFCKRIPRSASFKVRMPNLEHCVRQAAAKQGNEGSSFIERSTFAGEVK